MIKSWPMRYKYTSSVQGHDLVCSLFSFLLVPVGVSDAGSLADNVDTPNGATEG